MKTGFDKLPPQAIDLEVSVLGGLLYFPTVEDMVTVFEILKHTDFYKEQHSIIFKTMFDMFIQDEKIDVLTLCEKLRKSGEINVCGGAFYISSLTDNVSSNANIEVHARIVKQKSISRNQITFGSELVKKAYDETNDCFEVNDFMMLKTNEIINGIEINKEKTIDDVLKNIESNISIASLNGGFTGVLTGFTDLDKVYYGRQKGDLVIKAGRPAMGKTSQALCEAIYQAYTLNKIVLFFSLEMPTEQLVLRAISVITEIPLTQIKRGELSAQEWDLFYGAYEKIKNGQLYFFDSKYKISEIVSVCKKMKITTGIDIVYIDYLQLIEAIEKKNGNREQEISANSRTLKQLAKNLEAPVVALCQLSRAVESRGGNKKPLLSDLRESGAIEQDADVVEFIYRPEYYGIETDEKGESLKGLAYILIAKNRNGSCEDVPLRFIGYLTKFENIKPNFDNEIKPNDNFF